MRKLRLLILQFSIYCAELITTLYSRRWQCRDATYINYQTEKGNYVLSTTYWHLRIKDNKHSLLIQLSITMQHYTVRIIIMMRRRRMRRDLIGLKLTSVLQWVSSQRIYFIKMNSRDMTSGHLCARYHSMHYRQESPIEGKRYYNFTVPPQGKRFYIFKCWRKQRTPSLPSLPQYSAGVVAKPYQSTW